MVGRNVMDLADLINLMDLDDVMDLTYSNDECRMLNSECLVLK